MSHLEEQQLKREIDVIINRIDQILDQVESVRKNENEEEINIQEREESREGE